jgi:hypothetical protein
MGGSGLLNPAFGVRQRGNRSQLLGMARSPVPIKER